jgi:hypothetical protein
MDQPTAEEALRKMEPLIGEWMLEAIPPGGEPWPGEARATIEWHDSGAHVVERSSVLQKGQVSSASGATEPESQHPQMLDELRRLVNVEVDAEHRDA